MAKTMINVKVDSDVKEEALKVAKELGLSLSSLMRAFVKDLIRTRKIQFGSAGSDKTGGLTNQEKQALQQFKQELMGALPGEAPQLKLFGSKARGDADKYADVDVLVIVETHDHAVENKIYKVLTQVMLDTDIVLSLIIMSKNRLEKLRRMGSPFIANIDREGIEI